MNCTNSKKAFIAALMSITETSCGGNSANNPGQGTGGAASTMSTTGGAPTGGWNGTGGSTGTNMLSAGGASFDAGVICSRNFDWMDPKCGGLAAPCASEPCYACGIAQCSNVLVEMFGADWVSGTPTGPCASVLNCIRACACEDVACYRTCPFPSVIGDASSPNAPCGVATLDLTICSGTICKSQCQTSGA